MIVVEDTGHIPVILNDDMTTSGERQVKIEETIGDAVTEQSKDDVGLTAKDDSGKQGNRN